MNVVAGIFIIAGSLLAMIGGIGVIRFGDLMSRVHAAAKAPTLGLLLIAVGAAIEIGSADAIVTLALVVVLQLLTSPVATHVLARASYGQVDFALDGKDDLADYYASLSDSDGNSDGDSDGDSDGADGSG
jgi:multicomponent Na+:H+ antiporter subunit G